MLFDDVSLCTVGWWSGRRGVLCTSRWLDKWKRWGGWADGCLVRTRQQQQQQPTSRAMPRAMRTTCSLHLATRLEIRFVVNEWHGLAALLLAIADLCRAGIIRPRLGLVDHTVFKGVSARCYLPPDSPLSIFRIFSLVGKWICPQLQGRPTRVFSNHFFHVARTICRPPSSEHSLLRKDPLSYPPPPCRPLCSHPSLNCSPLSRRTACWMRFSTLQGGGRGYERSTRRTSHGLPPLASSVLEASRCRCRRRPGLGGMSKVITHVCARKDGDAR